MLVKYRDYILSQGDTLLTIYLGLYEICIGEQKTLFVTMLNVFPPSVQVRMQYDLKGVWPVIPCCKSSWFCGVLLAPNCFAEGWQHELRRFLAYHNLLEMK